MTYRITYANNSVRSDSLRRFAVKLIAFFGVCPRLILDYSGTLVAEDVEVEMDAHKLGEFLELLARERLDVVLSLDPALPTIQLYNDYIE